jgi:5'-nucleotidase
MGVPGLALSLDGFRDPLHFEPFAAFAAGNLYELVGLWNREHFININSPNMPEREKEVVVTSPAVRFYNDRLASFRAPSGEMYYFLDGTPAQTELQPGTDWHAVADGKISVSPIYLNPINHRDEIGYRSASFLSSEVSRS